MLIFQISLMSKLNPLGIDSFVQCVLLNVLKYATFNFFALSKENTLYSAVLLLFSLSQNTCTR